MNLEARTQQVEGQGPGEHAEVDDEFVNVPQIQNQAQSEFHCPFVDCKHYGKDFLTASKYKRHAG